MLVAQARSRGAALALEDLRLPRGGGRGRRMRRRLPSWPWRELHRQLEYKAEEQGVPLIKVNPRNTSKTCPRSGEVKERRSRVGRVFVCASCGWRCDRQLNAGRNICQTVLREAPQGPSNSGLGGLRMDPDALPKDAMGSSTPRVAPGRTGGADGRGGSEPPHRQLGGFDSKPARGVPGTARNTSGAGWGRGSQAQEFLTTTRCPGRRCWSTGYPPDSTRRGRAHPRRRSSGRSRTTHSWCRRRRPPNCSCTRSA
jgi:IS605 OrfB family transposase